MKICGRALELINEAMISKENNAKQCENGYALNTLSNSEAAHPADDIGIYSNVSL